MSLAGRDQNGKNSQLTGSDHVVTSVGGEGNEAKNSYLVVFGAWNILDDRQHRVFYVGIR